MRIHAILKLIPQLGDLLKTFPGRNDAINEFRKKKTPEIEAAAWLSLVVIEKVMLEIPAETRLLTLQQLDHKKDDSFVGSAKRPKPC